MYIQCKVYLQLWRRLKAFNRIITVQNCPEKGLHGSQARTSSTTISRHETVEVPVSPAPETQVDSDTSVEGTAAPVQNPVWGMHSQPVAARTVAQFRFYVLSDLKDNWKIEIRSLESRIS